MNTHDKCFLCFENELKPLIGFYDKHKLVKCQNCGFVFMENIPTIEEPDSHYSSYSYDSEGFLSPITVKSYNLLLDEFEKFRKTNKILDVGCGRGWFLLEAKKRGWEIFGTEFSKAAAKLCDNKGINVKEGELDSTRFESKDFDVVTSFEVIEHINNPHKELQEIYKLLRKGGLYFCTTPNFNSLNRFYSKNEYDVIGYPEHLSYYSKRTLDNVMDMNSFKLIKFLSTGISVTRVKTSNKSSTEKFVANESSDETLRKEVEKRWYLAVAKKLVNTLLTWTNTGMTLKGYYVKI